MEAYAILNQQVSTLAKVLSTTCLLWDSKLHTNQRRNFESGVSQELCIMNTP